MLNAEEKKLTKAQEALENIEVPELQLDEAIAAGISKGKRKKKQNLLFMRTFASAAILIFAFTAMLRTSETFASYVTSLPGMEKIVELVRFDKGLTSAIENDFAQKIGVSDEHDGLKVTLDSVIVDEQMMVLFYKVETSGAHKEVSIDKFLLTDQEGKGIEEIAFSYDGWSIDMQDKGRLLQATFEFYGDHRPDNFKLSMELSEGRTEEGEPMNKLADTWVIPFSIDKDAFKDKKETIEVNETVEIEGQKVTVEKVSIYPTRIGVTVHFDEGNSKQLFGFEDLTLVDETGEEWAAINNGTTARHMDEYTKEFFLQSNFFKKPEELYLRFNSLRALDKDEVEIIVDPEKMEVLKAPADGRLIKVDREENHLLFAFQKGSREGHNHISFEQAVDQNGKEIGDGSASFRWNAESPLEVLIPYFGEGASPGPITLRLNDYPAAIKGEAKIRLK
ncbi:DUF4179 domain-containing protein [Mesobacillus subterraneus]|uniref:DUF4179 domain-containing protein n=1 Tax=Mesobacillus subterraneus TaxID=285983 RepID=A0A3R9EA84_9BACI|nr:DUF4179 domain-containing protein [Mesobacillus subterraneus]RSD27340.1 DUF4179 domain-containing protein [Mesobacillus subterraneus]